jgi:hypothetical protein
MEFAELGLCVTVAYDDLSDVWSHIQHVSMTCVGCLHMICSVDRFDAHLDHTRPPQALESRLPLRQVTLINKLGGSPVVDKLPLQ